MQATLDLQELQVYPQVNFARSNDTLQPSSYPFFAIYIYILVVSNVSNSFDTWKTYFVSK